MALRPNSIRPETHPTQGRRDLDKAITTADCAYEAPVLRVHGTLEEMTHGRGHGGFGGGWGWCGGRPHRPHDPCDYTFS